ncbi:MAG: isocitrate lyase/phosphoenolpyruvate mutase family protein [Pseudomonadales bacterium]|nr:isocitrate lyase/phosphoenolpyruvate mutase family protein [Pseudomonadales bacterium]MCP5185826.1 isocitrate lyase/phosphoenolpyruvate mutase family protein [Pseudomonadales bacterium]
MKEPGENFRALHAPGSCFVIANAWDAGSARILAGMGFAALATSSGASAATLGRLDGQVRRDEALAQAAAIAAAVSIPVSADLERGFGKSPETVESTVRLAGSCGLAGCSIEDASGEHEAPVYDFQLAVERVAAAAEAARSLPSAFVLTARAENCLHGIVDLDDTIRRLQAFEKAGADVLFAPGLPSLDAVRQVCAAVSRPVNFMVGIPGRSFSVAELANAGVTRISLASSLHRAAMTGMMQAASEVLEKGTFTYLDALVSGRDMTRHFSPPR